MIPFFTNSKLCSIACHIGDASMGKAISVKFLEGYTLLSIVARIDCLGIVVASMLALLRMLG
jgi:hypothetical protein